MSVCVGNKLLFLNTLNKCKRVVSAHSLLTNRCETCPVNKTKCWLTIGICFSQWCLLFYLWIPHIKILIHHCNGIFCTLSQLFVNANFCFPFLSSCSRPLTSKQKSHITILLIFFFNPFNIYGTLCCCCFYICGINNAISIALLANHFNEGQYVHIYKLHKYVCVLYLYILCYIDDTLHSVDDAYV